MGSTSSLEWKFSRDVRLHGLRLLRCRHWPGVLPKRKPICIADALVDDLWRRLSHAPSRRFGPGRVYRQAWAARGITADSHTDVGGNLLHRLHARVRFDWPLGSSPGSCRKTTTGLFGWHGTWWRFCLSI